MVGADDLLLEMKSKLTSDGRNQQIIPIVGMGGSGKTTLALNIYQDGLIKEHFDVRAWVTISQEYSIREILVQLLTQLIKEFDPNSSEGELGEMLHKHMYGVRYIVVLDDMWSLKPWDGLKRFLPDNKKGSRIVVTTRLTNLASDLSGSERLEMELLDKANSWDLLSETVFGEKGCPLELVETGKRIGLSCKGLPLSIVVVGGLLAKSKHTREFWEYIEGNLCSVVNLEDNERCLKILYMSYKQLPVHLKPCFLCMGVYPEGVEIQISKLIKLWVAEGFLKLKSGKSSEEVATMYLKDLIDRNLISVHKLGCTGNIKECKVHDLLRDLCLREAEKECFLTASILSTPRKHSWRELLSGFLPFFKFLDKPLEEDVQRRIVISSSGAAISSTSSPSLSLARSLIWDVDEYHELPPHSFKLLRILESRGKKPSPARAAFLRNLSQFVNSRFLQISAISSECRFPSSIWLFWNLQTLIVGHTWEATAPVDIWYMPRIRHIKFHFLHFHSPPTSGQDQDNVLSNLQTLGVMKYLECSEQVVKRIPNIKKLQLFYEGYEDKYCLNNLCRLDKLESLRCQFTQEIEGSVESLISFPHSLKKLTLKMDESQCWEEILDKIGALPHLQKLQLESGNFGDNGRGKLETSEGQFPSLKFLLLREFRGLYIWKAESSHFPCLEHIVLDRLWKLRELPLEFSDISTLRVIEMAYCRASAVESAKEDIRGTSGVIWGRRNNPSSSS